MLSYTAKEDFLRDLETRSKILSSSMVNHVLNVIMRSSYTIQKIDIEFTSIIILYIAREVCVHGYQMTLILIVGGTDRSIIRANY